MTLIIDSLKRLERAGSESSRATQKLCLAADTVAKGIAEMVPSAFQSDPNARAGRTRPLASVRPAGASYDHHYYVPGGISALWRQVGDSGDLEDLGHQHTRCERAVAVGFAEDIAAGLLDVIAANLECWSKRDEERAGFLAQAQAKLV